MNRSVVFAVVGFLAVTCVDRAHADPVDSGASSEIEGVVLEGHAGVLVNPYGTISGIGIEARTEGTGFTVQVGRLYYEYDEYRYFESGDGLILTAQGRYYAQDDNGLGLWLAAGVSLANFELYWRETGSYSTTWAEERVTAFIPSGSLGYKVSIGDGGFFADPHLFIGLLMGTDSDIPMIGGIGVNISKGL